jgi:hypothetical protein
MTPLSLALHDVVDARRAAQDVDRECGAGRASRARSRFNITT